MNSNLTNCFVLYLKHTKQDQLIKRGYMIETLIINIFTNYGTLNFYTYNKCSIFPDYPRSYIFNRSQLYSCVVLPLLHNINNIIFITNYVNIRGSWTRSSIRAKTELILANCKHRISLNFSNYCRKLLSCFFFKTTMIYYYIIAQNLRL